MRDPAISLFWQRYGLTTVLALAVVVFLGAIGYETGWGQALQRPLPAASDKAPPTDMLATLPTFSLPSLDSAFKETADRPLFTPTRRPSASNLAANVPAMKKGQFKLSGTSVNNDLTIAFLLETATGKTVRVTKGKEVNGMTLDAVEANRVVLKQGEETEELTLRTAPSPPIPKAAAVVPASVPTSVPGTVPAVPTATASVPPVAGAVAGVLPPPRVNPVPQSQNPFVPAPGSSQLPGFVMPTTPGSAGVAPPPSKPAQGRQ